MARAQELLSSNRMAAFMSWVMTMRHGLWTFCHELFQDCGNCRILTGHR